VCRLQLLLALASAVILGYKSRGTHGQYFIVSDSRLPQPGEPGSRINIPQEQGGPVIPPGIGFPFRRLLRLEGLRWRYSNPPLHLGSATGSARIYCNDSDSVRTSQETHYVSKKKKKPNRLMLFRETIAVYYENHTVHTDTLYGQNAKF
jgi:hypothetical protein